MGLKKKMIAKIDAQREGVPSVGIYMLEGFSDSQLVTLARFIRSFKREKKTGYKDEIAALRADRVKLQGEIERLTHELAEARSQKQDGAAFPTGAGTTVEDAVAVAEAEAWTAALVQEPVVESEPLIPQRGDRVRLEGARSIGGFRVEDGWYDVVGQRYDSVFQIAEKRANGGAALCWIEAAHPGLKEVRRGAAKLPE